MGVVGIRARLVELTRAFHKRGQSPVPYRFSAVPYRFERVSCGPSAELTFNHSILESFVSLYPSIIRHFAPRCCGRRLLRILTESSMQQGHSSQRIELISVSFNH